MVDMTDLKSVGLKARGGSTPLIGTKYGQLVERIYGGLQIHIHKFESCIALNGRVAQLDRASPF